MKNYLPRLAVIWALLGLAAGLQAQTLIPERELKEAKSEQIQTKDDAVVIDELRIRGETKRLSVTPKNAPAYQIEPDSARKGIDDKTQGQRTWRLFSF